FYSSSGAGGFGGFGTIDLTNPTFVTNRLLTLAASHGAAFDPSLGPNGKIVLMGDSHVTIIDPTNPGVIFSDRTFAGVNFDQGSVDGHGHIYAASNTGDLVFIDVSASGGDLNAASTFVHQESLDSFLDDVAPLTGPGSGPAVPEASKFLLSAIGIVGL